MLELIQAASMSLLDPIVILAIILGTVGGIIIGAIPGLTATMAVALLIPVTFGMDTVVGLALMGGVYSGGMYGGAISSILLCTPGTPAAAATAMDGYPLTRKGHGGMAITIATVASFTGGIISTLLLLLIAPLLARFALQFGPPEKFLLAIMGLASIVTLTSGNLVKGIISGLIGLVIATVGMDPISGYLRFTFKNINLFEGVPYIPALLGLFSVSQILGLTSESTIVQETATDINTLKREKLPKGLFPTMGRGGLFGSIIGMLPGAGATIASFISYNFAKQLDKKPETFGKGNPKGVAAAESANNGVVGGSLVPLLTLGIPGNSVAAALMGGLMIKGLIPGPELFTKHGQITYAFILSLLIANIVFLFLGIYFAPLFARIATVSNAILIPAISILSVVGSYAIRNSLFDVGLMLGFGIFGYFIHKAGFSLGAIVLGIILGPIAELGFGQSIIMSNGSPSIFFSSTICIILWIIIVLLILPTLLKKFKKDHSIDGVTSEE